MFLRPYLNQYLGSEVHSYHPSLTGSINRKFEVQVDQAQMQNCIKKKTKKPPAKRDRGVSHMGQHLPGKSRPSLNPSITKKQISFPSVVLHAYNPSTQEAEVGGWAT
jgi:hypothetical protein